MRLLSLGDGAQVLLDGVGGLAHASDLDDYGLVEHRVDRSLDGGRQRCREEQGLALLGECCDDASDAGPETHIQHAVGLVEHEDLDVFQVHVVVLHQVDQTAWRGYQEVAALLELANLAFELGTAHDDDGLLVRVLAYGGDDLLDLGGELTRGRNDQREGSEWLGVGVGRARLGSAAP